MNDEPLPTVYRAEIDPEAAVALLTDIGAQGGVVLVTLKGPPGVYSSGESHTLRDALSALRDETVRGIQLRYALDGGEAWLDTLLRTTTGWRLVRIGTQPG